ncbi:hypothetical protein Tco_1154435 [Tanacetum coccineum]
MLLNLDQLEKQLGKEEFQETDSMDVVKALKTQFQLLISFQYNFDGFEDLMICKYFLAYTRIEVEQFRNTLIQHMESTQKSKVVLGKVLDADLVVMESNGTESGKQDTSGSLGNNITHAVDADIRPVNDQVPFAEVQLTAKHNVLANEQHTEQSEPIYDTYLFEKVNSNTTPDSTNMSHMGGEINQDAEQYQVKSPLINAELVKSKEMIEKEKYNELSQRFLLLEKHCISLELEIQQKEASFQSNKPGKNQDAPEFREFFEINDLKAQLQAKTILICNLKNQNKSVKEASNEAKVKNDIDVIKTINIKLEHSVAKLLATNEQLHKENEHLKQTYKKLYDSIKKTCVQNKDNSDSLISQINQKYVENANLKALIQEKVFANATLKDELRKLKGNSMDTKFVKASILGKPPLQPSRNHSVVRQLNAFKESAPAKPHHLNAPSSSKNLKKESYGSSDMAHNHFLEEAKKKTQDRNWNLKPREMPSARTHHTPNACTPKPRSNNQTFRNWPASESSNVKSSAVHEKTSPRSCLRWKPTGRIFKTIGLRWIPTGKMFTDITTKVDSEPPNGLNDDITNPYECDQTLNVSADTLNLSACTSFNPKKEKLRVWLLNRLISQKPGVQGSQM